jgi:GR25 family glycosyltransferase involved in LPS biosynthesis
MRFKAYIISLSKIESSITTANLVLNFLTNSFDAELFEGVYGTDAIELLNKENRTVHPFGFKSKNENINGLIRRIRLPTDADSKNKMLQPGVIGCFYSHYKLWQKCVELNERIFIFEDDVLFVRDYTPVEFDEVLIVALGKELYRTKLKDVFENPVGIPSALQWARASMPGNVGYGITPIAASKLLDTYKNTFLSADNAINQFEVNIKIHSHLMGRAMLADDGKISLTNSEWK